MGSLIVYGIKVAISAIITALTFTLLVTFFAFLPTFVPNNIFTDVIVAVCNFMPFDYVALVAIFNIFGFLLSAWLSLQALNVVKRIIMSL